MSQIRVIHGTVSGILQNGAMHSVVSLLTTTGHLVECTATPSLTEVASRLLQKPIFARVVEFESQQKLVDIRNEADPSTPLSDEEIKARLLDDWSETFRRLAQ